MAEVLEPGDGVNEAWANRDWSEDDFDDGTEDDFDDGTEDDFEDDFEDEWTYVPEEERYDRDDDRAYGCAGPGGWCAPLHVVEAKVAGKPWARYFDVDDFSLVARLRHRDGTTITLNKHVYTRRYLNLDTTGRAYRYVAPPPDAPGSGDYVPYRHLRDAVAALGLAELPAMKDIEPAPGVVNLSRRSRRRP